MRNVQNRETIIHLLQLQEAPILNVLLPVRCHSGFHVTIVISALESATMNTLSSPTGDSNVFLTASWQHTSH